MSDSRGTLHVGPADLARCDSARSFLQSGFWGSFKARFGWNARAFTVDWRGDFRTPLLVIRRRLAPGASFAYVPWGPELPPGFSADDGVRTDALREIAESLRSQLPPDTLFVRFDPPWANQGPDACPPIIHAPFIRAGADIQAPNTVVVNLDADEDAILAAMKPKWRYNIRLAERKGVVVRRLDAAGIDVFYQLFVETAARDGIAVHGIEYYRTLFSHAAEYSDTTPRLHLYVAEAAGNPLASIIVLMRKDEATYLYGASSDRNRALMPAYALQWNAMRDAKSAGCLRYDLFGIAPTDDPAHPMAGLYRFKTGFGGCLLKRSGSWDYVYRPIAAAAFRSMERARKMLRDAKKAFKKRGGVDL